MRYLSVCSGVEAASVAWEPMGWTPVGFCEVDPFCSAVLRHRWPTVENFGDFRSLIHADRTVQPGTVDMLVGGTPCQSFSTAGKRGGLSDERGGLTVDFLRLAGVAIPRWIIWENVPGVLHLDGGRVFGAFLGGLAELGYGWAYRVLDAQYFGVPQVRRRVFVVAHSGGAAHCAAKVLFEPEGLCWFDRAGGSTAKADPEADQRRVVSYDGYNHAMSIDIARTVSTSEHHNRLLILDIDRDGEEGLRRMTPLECERLQGFPDNHTLIGAGQDALRYAAIGNSMAVPVMRWIGEGVSWVDNAMKGAA